MAGARPGITERASTAIERSKQAPPIYRMIEAQEREVARALPSHLKNQAPAFLRSALTVVKQTPQLAECDPYTILGGLMTASQLGLELGPLGLAYLMPRRVKGRWEAVFVLGYKGAIELAWRSGRLESIAARTVHEGDEFDYEFGLADALHHKPTLTNRGPAYAWYMVAKFTGGGHYFNVLGPDDVERHRKASPGSDSEYSPWRNHFDQMALKSCIHEAKPYLPLTTEVAANLDRDNLVVRGATVEELTAEPAGFLDVDVETGELPPPAEAEPLPGDAQDPSLLDDGRPYDEDGQ